MDKRVLYSLFLAAGILALSSCSEGPAGPEPTVAVTENKPVAPPEAVAAQSAFFAMYKPARTWAADLLPLTLTSGEVPGVKNADGKAGLWTAIFVSPSKHEARTFFYAVAEGNGQHKGVNMGGAQPWSGPTAKSKPFQVTEFLTNSDAAYKVALEKAGPWVKKHPEKQCSLFLANASGGSAPLWYVLWGNTKDGYLAHVNATTGTLANIK
jgi:hypothetical protein